MEEVTIILGIIGLVCLLLSYPVFKVMEKRDSRWSNMVLSILVFVGIVCLGLFAGL